MRAISLLMLVSSLGFAQNPGVEERKPAAFQEIERGFFFEGRAGFWGTIAPPVLAGNKSYFSSGQAVQLDIGYDIGERVSPSVFFLASGNRMGSDYTGLSTTRTSSGDYSSLGVGGQIKVRLVGLADSQEVKRTWFYLKGAAGPEFYQPAALLPNLDVLLMLGGGVEYFTRLRHFSIGLEASFSAHLLSATFGFAVLPTVKYAF
jgi:hypothetical protein